MTMGLKITRKAKSIPALVPKILRIGPPPKAAEKVGPRGVIQVIRCKCGLHSERVEQDEAGGGSVGHRDGDGPVEIHHR